MPPAKLKITNEGNFVTDPVDFRQDVRDWLEANCPQTMRRPYRSEADVCWGGRNVTFQSDDQKLWLERMAARGWTVPAWPKEYGGAGLDSQHNKILKEELGRIQARNPLESFGISMLGPALLKFGADALKQQHLPAIARGEGRVGVRDDGQHLGMLHLRAP